MNESFFFAHTIIVFVMKLQIALYKGGYKMKAHVDKDTCIGCGLCPSICDTVFSMDDDGKAVAITSDVPAGHEDDVQEAASSCPVEAISVN